MSTKYVCGKCGSSSIWVTICIDPNDPYEQFGSHQMDYEGQCDCDDCDATTNIEEVAV